MNQLEVIDPSVSSSVQNGHKLSFASLPLSEALLKNLASLGYTSMTAIQALSLPLTLQGKDVIARAKTGSGKTAAFGLSILNNLNTRCFSTHALILCPTRELAEQVSQTLRSLARLIANVKIVNLSGGVPMKSQLDSLRHGVHIIVGTPGRIQKHLDRQSLSLIDLRVLILDEADRMLDMGFLDDIKAIIASCPKNRQTLLFSATYPSEIKKLCNQFMIDPKEVHVDTVHSENSIQQIFYEVQSQHEKFSLLKKLLLHHRPTSTLIFCNTKEQTNQLAKALFKIGFSVGALNGDMEQPERDLAMIQFSNQSCSILVATDVAARGLDIKELPAVINYDLAFEPEVHLHRIGRTGRAGHEGLAISLTVPADAERTRVIELNLGRAVSWGLLDELTISNPSTFSPEMITLCIDAGRKDKIRPGDILGALVKEAHISSEAIGKINIVDRKAFVAVHKSVSDKAYQYLLHGRLKGRSVFVRKCT